MRDRLSAVLVLGLAACSGQQEDQVDDCTTCRDASPDQSQQIDGGGEMVDADVLDAAHAEPDATAPEPDATSPEDDAGTDAEAEPICTAEARRCASATTLEVCAEDGRSWNSLECDRGCELNADAGVSECLPSDLSEWEVRLFSVSDQPATAPASYTFSEDGTVATQTVNANPSLYLNSRVFEDVIIRGQFRISNADTDDDYVGFVFGYQDDAHFYMLDWKQKTQGPTSASLSCNTANIGISLKRVSGDEAPNLCADFWDSAGTEKVVVLSPASAHAVGWKRNVDYDFVLEHSPGSIRIRIMEGATQVAQLESNDATYGQGKFAFYNYSQAGVTYKGFRFEPKP
jgi:hypothetical protein